MAKIEYDVVFTGICGRVGELVHYERNGTHCTRRWVNPADPKTPKQIARRQMFAKLVAEWRNMDQTEKAGWKRTAGNKKKGQTGFNSFMSTRLKTLRI